MYLFAFLSPKKPPPSKSSVGGMLSGTHQRAREGVVRVCNVTAYHKKGLLGPDSRDAIYYPNHHKLLQDGSSKGRRQQWDTFLTLFWGLQLLSAFGIYSALKRKGSLKDLQGP